MRAPRTDCRLCGHPAAAGAKHITIKEGHADACPR